MKIYLVGVKQDNGKVDHIRPFTNKTWAKKYARPAGDAAVYLVVDGEFVSEIPADLKDEPATPDKPVE